jgi:hypothetical protein
MLNTMRGVNWIYLAEGKDRLRALLNMVMKIRVPQNVKNFMTD